MQARKTIRQYCAASLAAGVVAALSFGNAVAHAAIDEKEVSRGHELFNSTCAHCHGSDAASFDKRTDLRRLHIRYGSNAEELFWTTVNNGRLDKGMPTWKGVIPEKDLESIKAYVFTVQRSK